MHDQNLFIGRPNPEFAPAYAKYYFERTIGQEYDGLKESLQALAKAFPEKDYTKYFELLEARWV